MSQAADTSAIDAVPMPPRRSRRFVAALLAGSCAIHLGLLGWGAHQAKLDEQRHPVVEVMSWTATETVGDDGERDFAWSYEGRGRARITAQ